MTVIKIKNSSVAGNAPDAADLERAELAINLADGRLYTKDQNDAIIELGAAGDVPSGNTPPLTGNQPGDLFWDTSNNTLNYWNGTAWEEIAIEPATGSYVEDAGDNMTGNLTFGPEGGTALATVNATTGKITGAATVDADPDGTLVTKGYLEDELEGTGGEGFVEVAGDNMTGNLTFGPDGGPAVATVNATSGNGAFGQVSADTNAAEPLVGQRTGASDATGVVLRINNPSGTQTATIAGDGDAIFAGDVQMASQNGAQMAGFRNQIINGDFRVWQRGDGPHQSTVSFNYGPDRFRNFSNAQNQLTRSAVTPPGFGNTCLVDHTTGGSYTNNLGLLTAVELDRVDQDGAQFARGSTWTVSCVSNATSMNVDVFFGSDSTTTTNQVVNIQAMTQSAYQGSGTWFHYTYVINFPDTAVDSTARCLSVRFRTTGQSSWNITGCQLEPGPVATPFEHRAYAAELSLCQRYFQRIDAGGLGPVSRNIEVAGRNMSTTIPSNNQMRTTPTFRNASTANSNDIELQRHSGDTARVFTVTGCNNNGPFSIAFEGDTTDETLYIFMGSGRNVLHFDAEL